MNSLSRRSSGGVPNARAQGRTAIVKPLFSRANLRPEIGRNTDATKAVSGNIMEIRRTPYRRPWPNNSPRCLPELRLPAVPCAGNVSPDFRNRRRSGDSSVSTTLSRPPAEGYGGSSSARKRHRQVDILAGLRLRARRRASGILAFNVSACRSRVNRFSGFILCQGESGMRQLPIRPLGEGFKRPPVPVPDASYSLATNGVDDSLSSQRVLKGSADSCLSRHSGSK